MKATELITALQGLIEKHGDNIKVCLEIYQDDYSIYPFEYTAFNFKVEEDFMGEEPWILILGENSK